MPSFVLHAGLHKTATTSLQEQVFPSIASVLYTGKSRQVMSVRKTIILPQFVAHCQEDKEHIKRLPAHTCAYYLSLLQDRVVSRLARSKETLQSVQPLIGLMNDLLERIDQTSPETIILYSCEGLLLCLGHVCPKQALKIPEHKRDQAPLFYYKQLFPGRTQKIVIYVRSPIDYLYSRYIQIHTVKMQRSKHFVMTPAEYLSIQGKLYSEIGRQQSIFYHVYHRELAQDLESLGPKIAVRSYDKHILNSPSISKEIDKAFGLQVLDPDKVDTRFKQQPLNTTDRDKDEAIKNIMSHMGFSNHSQLKHAFQETAESNSLVRAALSSTIFS